MPKGFPKAIPRKQILVVGKNPAQVEREAQSHSELYEPTDEVRWGSVTGEYYQWLQLRKPDMGEAEGSEA